MRYNFNDMIRVRLTDEGRRIHRANHERLLEMMPPAARDAIGPYQPKEEDADGWSEWQGWDLMREFGPWMMTAFAALAKMRRLRGTHLDIFGYTAERKRERADIDAYRKLIGELVAGLHNGNYALARELAASPRTLRGFGHVKDRNREQLAAQQLILLQRFREAQSATHTL